MKYLVYPLLGTLGLVVAFSYQACWKKLRTFPELDQFLVVAWLIRYTLLSLSANQIPTRFLPEEFSFWLQGDHLIAECTYSSESRGVITLGGLTTREETCLVSALYYPRIDLSLCYSLPSLPTVLHSLGIQKLIEWVFILYSIFLKSETTKKNAISTLSNLSKNYLESFNLLIIQYIK